MGTIIKDGVFYTGTSQLSDLGDTNISSPTSGQVLSYDSTNEKWINADQSGGVSTLSALTDVSVSSPTSGQILKYNTENDKWENANESAVSSELSELTDVAISSVSNGQVLKYNISTQKWENDDDGGSSTVAIDVKSFGAVGDGITDDTTAFANAIAECEDTSNILFVSAGNYLITSRLIAHESIFILGAGVDKSIISFRNNTTNTETAYDATWWEESNSALIIEGENSTLMNFMINGGDNTASPYNGISFHYPKQKENLDWYYAAPQRVLIQQIKVTHFKNGLFMYGAWNRYINTSEFNDNSACGIKYYPLEPDTVGLWSGSGDAIVSCQFIANDYGYYAKNNMQSTLQNCVFEYNDNAIYIIDCKDVVFKNCWNEANTSNIYIKGCAKFEGGYNINKNTIDHYITNSRDLLTIENETLITSYRGNELIFKQDAGVITKGVEITEETNNMVTNPYFSEESQGTGTTPSSTGWDLYTTGVCSVSDTTTYEGAYTGKVEVSGRTGDNSWFGFRQEIPINDATLDYTFSFKCSTPDRSQIDRYVDESTTALDGVAMYIAYVNASGATIMGNDQLFALICNNSWEEKSYTLTDLPNDTATIRVGFGLARNGCIYVANPTLVDNNSFSSSDVHISQNDDPNKVNFYTSTGSLIGTVDVVNQVSDLTDLGDISVSSPSDGQYLKYNSTNSKWENATGGGGGSSNLSDLDDVELLTPTNGQMLRYNSTTEKWENFTFANANNYSTTEQVIGTWTNGKLLYQKTLHFNLPSGSGGGEHEVAHGIVNLDDLVNYYGRAKWSDGASAVLPYIYSAGNNSGWIALSTGNLSISHSIIIDTFGLDRSSLTFDITLQYTKTTD